MVAIIAVVKDEDDVVEQWITYHAALVGGHNIWILDNGSTDNTANLLAKWSRICGIHVGRLHDYALKGRATTDIMRQIYKQHRRGELVIPLDIDEFLVLLDESAKAGTGETELRIRCTNADLLGYMRTLPVFHGVYKMAYLNAILPNAAGFQDAVSNTQWAQYSHIGNNCKSFVYSPLFQGAFDHGNHMPSHPACMTRLALIHFHTRNMEQQKKKTRNNLLGLGYPADSAAELSAMLARGGSSLMGYHHLEIQIRILNGTYKLPFTSEADVQVMRRQGVRPTWGCTGPVVSLAPFIERVRKCRALWPDEECVREE